MKSSTEWVCDVCDSQLLPASSSGRFKNNLSRWMPTSEVEGWRSVADLELDTRSGMLWLSHLGNVMGKCKALQTRNFLLAKSNDENDFESNLNTMQEKGEAGPNLAWYHFETWERQWLYALQDSNADSLHRFSGLAIVILENVLLTLTHHAAPANHPDFIESGQTATTGYSTWTVTAQKEKTGTVFFRAMWDKQT